MHVKSNIYFIVRISTLPMAKFKVTCSYFIHNALYFQVHTLKQQNSLTLYSPPPCPNHTMYRCCRNDANRGFIIPYTIHLCSSLVRIFTRFELHTQQHPWRRQKYRVNNMPIKSINIGQVILHVFVYHLCMSRRQPCSPDIRCIRPFKHPRPRKGEKPISSLML